ncbi:hypothetical protein Nans01_44500 [Nocardiopsis ansamitocini]|uniref:DUF732 domain-containing protein n=1 Tax=Nocardiopsis ansamitocini TaxID=1670832 RepID=A0A9W6P9J0_9ACTN|nr:hypothetical protein Nans01_44500 [Nocardiopsis ansamitocini]
MVIIGGCTVAAGMMLSGDTEPTPSPSPVETSATPVDPPSPEPVETDSPSPEPEHTYATDALTESVFLLAVRSNEYGAYWEDESDGDLVDRGHTVCSRLDDGDTLTLLALEAIAEVGADEDASAAHGALLGAAIVSYCPQHEDQLDSFAE